jgi:DNA-binding MarR family transcriptional regulator
LPPTDPSKRGEAADALAAVAPLASRWMERLLARHRPALTLPQYLALRAIGRETLGASELARRTGVSGPAVSQLVSALIDQGLVTRSPAAADRRRHELGLTARGKRVLESANRAVRSNLEELIEDLPRPETDALARGLPRVESLLSGAPPPRRPRPPKPGRAGPR